MSADPTDIFVSESCWSELAAAFPTRSRFIDFIKGEPAIVVTVLGKVIRIVRIKEERKVNIDHEDQKLATVHGGFDSVEDEQSWLQYLDGLAATHEAEMLERLAADSAYEERKLGKMMKEDF